MLDRQAALTAIAVAGAQLDAARIELADFMARIVTIAAVAELTGAPVPAAMKHYDPDNLRACADTLRAIREMLERAPARQLEA